MKKLFFATRESFDKWYDVTMGSDEVFYNLDFVCNILHGDFIYLLGIGFIDEDGVIAERLTTKQIELFKNNYGVQVCITEEMAQLSPKQYEIIKRYVFCLEEMRKNKIDICTDCDKDVMYFVNYNSFEVVGDGADGAYIPTNKLPRCPRISDVWFNSSTDKGIPCIL